jgi:hypothetical protein
MLRGRCAHIGEEGEWGVVLIAVSGTDAIGIESNYSN